MELLHLCLADGSSEDGITDFFQSQPVATGLQSFPQSFAVTVYPIQRRCYSFIPALTFIWVVWKDKVASAKDIFKS